MWQKIQQWFKDKGGVAHVIAGAWAFLLAAYALNPQFHSMVLKVHKSLPGWAEDGITLVLSLAGFYKTWKAATKPTSPPAAS